MGSAGWHHQPPRLWTVPKPEAHEIYRDVLRAAQRAVEGDGELIVVYFRVGFYAGDAVPALHDKALGAELLYQGSYASLHFGTDDSLLIYRVRGLGGAGAPSSQSE